LTWAGPILDGGEMGFRLGCWLVLASVLAVLSGCVAHGRSSVRQYAAEVTGSCEGACDHYLSCKSSESAAAHDACVTECEEIYEDPFTLAHFESLECVEAIQFVEGPSGRGPGTTVAQPVGGPGATSGLVQRPE
jgi:hypothetical protein